MVEKIELTVKVLGENKMLQSHEGKFCDKTPKSKKKHIWIFYVWISTIILLLIKIQASWERRML